MNRLDVMGNLVRDVEIAYTAKQNVVAKFMIAEHIYDFMSKQKKPQFYPMRAYGKRGEIIAKYFKKGDKIKIGGHLDMGKFETKDGKTKDYWLVIVDDFEFCDTRSEQVHAL